MAARRSSLVVLAGGTGKRLRTATNGQPKHMLLVGGKPLFAHALEQLIADFGVEHVVFRVAYRAEAFLEKWQAGQYPLPVPSTVMVGTIHDGPMGALASACNILGHETVIGVAGDVFFQNCSFGGLRDFHRGHGAAMTVAVAPGTPTRHPSTLEIDGGGTLVGYGRKELTTSDDLINGGLYVIERNRIEWLLADFARHLSQTGGAAEYREDELWRLTLQRPDRARFFVLPTRIVNVNTPDDLASANALAAAKL